MAYIGVQNKKNVKYIRFNNSYPKAWSLPTCKNSFYKIRDRDLMDTGYVLQLFIVKGSSLKKAAAESLRLRQFLNTTSAKYLRL